MVENERLKKYKSFSEKKRSEVNCPVCKKSFTNKYSLSNHFIIRGYKDGIKFIDRDHEIYWNNKGEEDRKRHKKEVKDKRYNKRCYRCNSFFEEKFEGRFRKQCPECRKKYPPKKKKPQNKFKKYPCYRCGQLILTKLSSNNKVCDRCREKERTEKRSLILKTPVIRKCLFCNQDIIYYKKHIKDKACRILCDICKNDPYRFKNHYKYNKVIYLLEDTLLTRREIKQLLNLEIDYIREAAIEKFGQEWYEERVKYIRKRGLLSSTFKKPSKLEKYFVSNLPMRYLQNDWLIIDIDNDRKRCEIDIIIDDNNLKFALFIDGEAFHGYQAYFKGPSIERDIKVALKLSEIGYYTIRYSESEIKSGWANKHFDKKYKEFILDPPTYYYRNWIDCRETVIKSKKD